MLADEIASAVPIRTSSRLDDHSHDNEDVYQEFDGGDAHQKTPVRAGTSGARATAIHDYRMRVIARTRHGKAPAHIDREVKVGFARYVVIVDIG